VTACWPRFSAISDEAPRRVRLDRYLHLGTGLSRSQAKKRVRTRRVTVDGETVRDAAFRVPADAVVVLEGTVVAPPASRHFMLNKPAGVVCATRDRTQPTVMDLLPPHEADGLVIAGRLDIDATGLVLLSEDGQWVHRVTAPRHKQPKVYRVCLAEPLAADAEKHLARGIFLKGENRRTLPAALERLGPNEVRLTVTEGRYHQVKRMFAALGNRVTALHRERIGPVALDPDLAPGESRRLSDEEIAAF
jgi:16S rRNA pseudouridine516 synthase